MSIHLDVLDIVINTLLVQNFVNIFPKINQVNSNKQKVDNINLGFLYTSNPIWQTQWIPITNDKTIEIHGIIVAKITIMR